MNIVLDRALELLVERGRVRAAGGDDRELTAQLTELCTTFRLTAVELTALQLAARGADLIAQHARPHAPTTAPERIGDPS